MTFVEPLTEALQGFKNRHAMHGEAQLVTNLLGEGLSEQSRPIVIFCGAGLLWDTAPAGFFMRVERISTFTARQGL